MIYLPIVLLGYLLGTSNMAWYLSRIKQADLRKGGSGNLGTSNAVMLLGWKAGILVGIHDIGKAALAVLLARWLFPAPYSGVVAGVSCVLGHIFPFYLRFKGGKGLASFIGMTLALDWKLALAVCVLLVIITLVTDYIVLGTLSTVLLVPTFTFFVSVVSALILCVATLVILYKHRQNFVRIIKGTEIGFRGAAKGDHRLDH